MLFNSWLFLGIFLPAILCIGLPLRGMARILFLIVASFVFYSYSGLEHGAVLAASIVWVHLWTGRPDRPLTRWHVAAAALLPMGALVYYKYLGFVVTGILHPLGLTAIAIPAAADKVLPAGISFFAFQLVSYAIDRQRGQIPQPERLPAFALFISFFPQLVAGPILRHHDVAEGLKALPRWRLPAERLPEIITLIAGGLFLKVVLADRIAALIAPLAADLSHLSRPDSLFVLFGYSFQIYFDFYGYSLIAIGLGLIFGLRFPSNFRLPYAAANPRDFWRRWHITLSYWIRDYLYLPLGGNRHYVRNIIIIFAVCGLWHGAGWNFVVWGLYHAMLVTGYHLLRQPWQNIPVRLQVFLTFLLVSAGWSLFLFDFADWAMFAGRLVGPAAGGEAVIGPWPWLLLAACLPVSMAVDVEALARRACTAGRAGTMLWGAGAAGMIYASLLYLDLSAAFIYFRF
ncbi:MBOAT family protein [Ferrovibrio sp.]|uniref:MBOAT family O-acyltransferase n=1 Tax=Ferrovibrio sp. TaxID=1917215 RepID=UPI003511B4C6